MMTGLHIDESNYTLESQTSNSAPTIKSMLNSFHKDLDTLAKKLNISIRASVNKGGLSYFAVERKAFLYLGPKTNSLKLRYYSGNKNFDGLPKSYWSNKRDMSGSHMTLDDFSQIDKAIDYSQRAIDIVISTFSSSGYQRIQRDVEMGMRESDDIPSQAYLEELVKRLKHHNQANDKNIREAIEKEFYKDKGKTAPSGWWERVLDNVGERG